MHAGAATASRAGSTAVREMNERSATTRSTGPPIASCVRCRTLQRSRTIDARVGPHGGVELTVTDVDGHHLRRAPLQEAVGEAPGRGARVEGAHVADVEPEPLEGGVELLPAPPHEAGRRAEELDGVAGRDEVGGLARDRPADGHEVLGDGRLRGGAARDEAPPDELGVQAAADGHRGATGVDRPGPVSGWRPSWPSSSWPWSSWPSVFLAGRPLRGGLLGRRLLGGRSSWPSSSSPWSSWPSPSWPVDFLAVDEVGGRRGAGRRAATGRPDADAGGQLLDPGLEVGQVDTHRLELLADLPLDEAHQVLGVLPTAGHQVLHGGLRLIDPELSGLLQVLRDLLGLGLGHLGEAQARVDEPLDEVVAGHLQQPTGIATGVDDAVAPRRAGRRLTSAGDGRASEVAVDQRGEVGRVVGRRRLDRPGRRA